MLCEGRELKFLLFILNSGTKYNNEIKFMECCCLMVSKHINVVRAFEMIMPLVAA